MSELNNLLMMFIKDGYSASGKVSKKTAMAMMRFVGVDKKLQSHVNSSDWKSVLNHDATTSGWISVDDKSPERKQGNKILAYGEREYVFEAEYDDGYWTNIGGDDFTYWKPSVQPPTN